MHVLIDKHCAYKSNIEYVYQYNVYLMKCRLCMIVIPVKVNLFVGEYNVGTK